MKITVYLKAICVIVIATSARIHSFMHYWAERGDGGYVAPLNVHSVRFVLGQEVQYGVVKDFLHPR